MKIIKHILLLFLLVSVFSMHAQQAITVGRESGMLGPFKVSGKIFDDITGEPLIGVSVYIEETKSGTNTDDNGYFELQLSRQTYIIRFSLIGYEAKTYQVSVLNNGSFNVKLKEDQLLLEGVIISGYDATQNIRSTDLGKVELSISTIETLPPFIGEVDIIKSITLLPGVSTVGEASAGFNVRGGGADQNLILIGGAPIYNPSHLFGFFTAFNADVVSGVTLHKGGIPAEYGGRSSSILDVKYKKGNFNRWQGRASIGTISSKSTIEGPIIKDKLSLLLSGRVSHINWFTNSVKSPTVRNSSAAFYDGNILVAGNINENNTLHYNYYNSADDFRIESDTTVGWKNEIQSFVWNSNLTKRLSLDLTLYQSKYAFSIFNESGVNDFELTSAILDQGLNLDFGFKLHEKHLIEFGAQIKFVTIDPGNLDPGASSGINPRKIEDEKGRESGVYVNYNAELTKKLALSVGLRYDLYDYLGGKTVYQYAENLPRSEQNIIGQTIFNDGEVIKSYDGLGPRASLRYALDDNTSLKFGYNVMYQFIHLISNTSTIAPTDVWKLSDQFLAPQRVTQYSAGIFRNWKSNTIETSIEAYYKDLNNIVEYKNGAELVLNDFLETQLLNGQGEAYGIEAFFKKNTGRLNGWASYTYSRSVRRVLTPFEEEQVNFGEWFPSNFDKPHDFTLVAIYNISRNTSFSANFSYSTGRPVTLPSAKFNYDGFQLAYFDERNGARIPDFHRLDISLKFKFNSDVKVLNGDWTLSIINAYGRKNPFSVFFDDVFGKPPGAFKLSVVGVPIPSLSYGFKF
ncbi:MAG TPA: TonB-dependent receptor [Cyclobacteriaceae bacterium]|nr:TonB-dependent receptor [Cyclobacteriaceae bacterium]